MILRIMTGRKSQWKASKPNSFAILLKLNLLMISYSGWTVIILINFLARMIGRKVLKKTSLHLCILLWRLLPNRVTCRRERHISISRTRTSTMLTPLQRIRTCFSALKRLWFSGRVKLRSLSKTRMWTTKETVILPLMRSSTGKTDSTI